MPGNNSFKVEEASIAHIHVAYKAGENARAGSELCRLKLAPQKLGREDVERFRG